MLVTFVRYSVRWKEPLTVSALAVSHRNSLVEQFLRYAQQSWKVLSSHIDLLD